MMDSGRFAQIRDLLVAVRGLPENQRSEYLARVCLDDPFLRDEVESLLAHDGDAPEIIRTGGAGDGLNSALSVPHPESIGSYQILGVLGEGGMGIVYHAEQQEPIRREVALKLVRQGMDSKGIVARFEAERQTLALMDHPNIAKVLDAGASPSGQPYFVMEIVRGKPITEYCKNESRTVRQRLDLFLFACRGVQHAHQKGIIHRDIKPSNVRVALQDGAPVTKIIDFGIAKAIEEPGSDLTRMTQAGLFVGTLEFMSPEQAGLIEGGVDTRTDVYSLGVLLYELLTDQRPYRFETGTHAEIVRVLGEQEPPKMSSAVIEEQGKRRRELDGDLDNIVRMAMEKDPERRYGSVEKLAEDVQRYLEGLPVRARSDTWTYRLDKYVRRNRIGVAVAASAVVVLLGFTAAMVVQSARVASERDRARVEAETAEQVSDFMVELFEVSDPGEARGNTITAREILDEGARRIPSELAEQPEVRASLMDAIGRVYHSLGLYDEASPLLLEALDTRQRLFGSNNTKVAESLNNLAFLFQDLGKYVEAESLLVEALATRRRLLGEEDPEVAASLASLASLLQDNGNLNEAEEIYRRVLELDRKLLGDDHQNIPLDLNNLASVLHQRGDFEEAEPLYREALERNRELLGEDHPEVATSLSNLANLLNRKGEREEAELLHRRALAVRRKLLGEEHPHVAISMTNLAVLLTKTGELDEAEALFRGAITIRRKTQGEHHPGVSVSLMGLAALLGKRSQFTESEALYREAIEIHRFSVEGGHPRLAAALSGLGRILVQTDRSKAAEPLFLESYEIHRDVYGLESRLTQRVLQRLIDLYQTLGEDEEVARYRELLEDR